MRKVKDYLCTAECLEFKSVWSVICLHRGRSPVAFMVLMSSRGEVQIISVAFQWV